MFSLFQLMVSKGNFREKFHEGKSHVRRCEKGTHDEDHPRWRLFRQVADGGELLFCHLGLSSRL